jgi:hypothetical protein
MFTQNLTELSKTGNPESECCIFALQSGKVPEAPTKQNNHLKNYNYD